MSNDSTPLAVLDTNLTVSGAISPHGLPNQVLRALQRDAFRLLSSRDLVEEVADVLGREHIRRRYRPDDPIVRAVLAAQQQAMIEPLPLDALPVHCRDPKDDPLLACALAGSADYIVTGDADLLALDGHSALGRLRIVTPRAFLALLDERDAS